MGESGKRHLCILPHFLDDRFRRFPSRNAMRRIDVEHRRGRGLPRGRPFERNGRDTNSKRGADEYDSVGVFDPLVYSFVESVRIVGFVIFVE